ncbi:MAG: hypothetical protein GWP06_12505 [Actinobacteria bacterium]|nr:hypothetical protein [Actinomycetota bacterium]
MNNLKSIKRKKKLRGRDIAQKNELVRKLRDNALTRAEEVLADRKHPLYLKAQMIKNGLIARAVALKAKKSEKKEDSKILKPYKILKMEKRLDLLTAEQNKYDEGSGMFKLLEGKRSKLSKRLKDHEEIVSSTLGKG